MREITLRNNLGFLVDNVHIDHDDDDEHKHVLRLEYQGGRQMIWLILFSFMFFFPSLLWIEK